MTIYSLYQEIVNMGTVAGRVDPYVRPVSGADTIRIAYGSGALASGVATVNTGLSTILAADVNLVGTTGFATGATEVSSVIIKATTGSLAIQGVFNSFVTGAATLSASGTGQFTWIAIGNA